MAAVLLAQFEGFAGLETPPLPPCPVKSLPVARYCRVRILVHDGRIGSVVLLGDWVDTPAGVQRCLIWSSSNLAVYEDDHHSVRRGHND
jgi:hypothetical protein